MTDPAAALDTLRAAVDAAGRSPLTPVRVRNRLMQAVRNECARLAGTDSGRELLAHAARFDQDARVRLHAAVTIGAWDRKSSADALSALIVAEGGEVIRPMGLTEALAVRSGTGMNAALCLLNLDNGDEVVLASPTSSAKAPGPAVLSADLDAAETVYSLAMNGGIEHAYEAVGPQFPAAASAFDAVGAKSAGRVLRDATRLLGPLDIPADRESREAAVMALAPDAEQQLAELNSQLWSMHDLMHRLESATEASS
jgi:hypothetical protein